MTTLERTLRMLRFVVVVGCLAIAGALTGTANAEPTGGNAITVTLFNCSGPAGTPSSFDIQKVPNPGVAAHVVGRPSSSSERRSSSSSNGRDRHLGAEERGEALITCSAVAPSGNLVIVTGFFTGP